MTLGWEVTFSIVVVNTLKELNLIKVLQTKHLSINPYLMDASVHFFVNFTEIGISNCKSRLLTLLSRICVRLHYFSGVARSSIFIAFDTLFQQMLHEHSVTVARICSSLRRNRPFMVPTAKHFALLYDLLFEAGLAGHSLVDLDVRSAFKTVSIYRINEF